MACQRRGRSWVPASRGSAADKGLLSAAVMNPPPGLADEIKMQMEEKESQRRFIFLKDVVNEFAIHRFVAQQDSYDFGPRPVDFLLAHGFVAITEMQANESNELSKIVLGGGLLQIRNRHESLPPIHGKHLGAGTIIDTLAAETFTCHRHGFHSIKTADSLSGFLVMPGTSAFSAGKPTGSSRKGFSLAGPPSTWPKKPMGIWILVKGATPM